MNASAEQIQALVPLGLYRFTYDRAIWEHVVAMLCPIDASMQAQLLDTIYTVASLSLAGFCTREGQGGGCVGLTPF